jgi:RNA polymerase sigma factor (sigma-70 family)
MDSDQADEFMPLLPGLIDGDRGVEDEFFRLAWSRLKAWAEANFFIPQKDQEDFAIEVIEKALGKIHRYSPSKGRFVTWLFVVARNHATDRARRLQGGLDVLCGVVNEDTLEWLRLAPDHGEAEPDCGIVNPYRTALDAALAQLPSSDRELLLLAYSGFNATQIAEQLLNLSADTVRQRHRRLLKKLRTTLNNYRQNV